MITSSEKSQVACYGSTGSFCRGFRACEMLVGLPSRNSEQSDDAYFGLLPQNSCFQPVGLGAHIRRLPRSPLGNGEEVQLERDSDIRSD